MGPVSLLSSVESWSAGPDLNDKPEIGRKPEEEVVHHCAVLDNLNQGFL
jgi:hypothetical protein